VTAALATAFMAEPGTAASRRAPRFREELDGTFVCSEIAQVTHDVKSFVLRPVQPGLFRFNPGQYLTLTVSVDGQELNRCYTIASSPTRWDELTITVKRTPGGPVSNWLHDTLQVGDTLPVMGPLGTFSTADHPSGRYLFLSAGSGITPLMSMTRAIHGRRDAADTIFVHNARTPDDLVFRSELARIAAEHPGIHVVAVCEADSAREQWKGLRGRLTLPLLQAIAPDLVDREVFTCGPPPYMDAVRSVLAQAGADPARCHEESFTFPGVGVSSTPEPAAAQAGAAAAGGVGGGTSLGGAATGTHSIEFRRSARTIECTSDTTILVAAARAGLRLPSSCGEGLCGTCKSTMLSGSVDMSPAGGIRPREIAQDKILLCCSTPREDLVVDA
jgi:ferredoxin-NADP reductase